MHALNATELRAIARNSVQLFDNIQLKPYGTQLMQLIIGSFLSITINSI